MRIALLVLLVFPLQTVMAADLSPYVNTCEATLKAETKFVEDGLIAVRDKWRLKVRAAFDAKGLTHSQRAAAEQAFATLVAKFSDKLTKALSLPAIFHTLNMMPVLPPETCKEPEKLRALGEQSIAGYEGILEELLPMIDTASEIAKSDG